jgi:hypothetical protein
LSKSLSGERFHLVTKKQAMKKEFDWRPYGTVITSVDDSQPFIDECLARKLQLELSSTITGAICSYQKKKRKQPQRDCFCVSGGRICPEKKGDDTPLPLGKVS